LSRGAGSGRRAGIPLWNRGASRTRRRALSTPGGIGALIGCAVTPGTRGVRHIRVFPRAALAFLPCAIRFALIDFSVPVREYVIGSVGTGPCLGSANARCPASSNPGGAGNPGRVARSIVNISIAVARPGAVTSPVSRAAATSIAPVPSAVVTVAVSSVARWSKPTAVVRPPSSNGKCVTAC